MASEHGTAAALQFDTLVSASPSTDAQSPPGGATCVACATALNDEYFQANGAVVCIACRDTLAQSIEIPRGVGPVVRAAFYGIAAAIAGALLYFAVMAITGFEIGLVAIAIGFMVGYAIRRGAAGKGGRRFQVLALVLTYWSVGLAYIPLVYSAAQEEARSSIAATANGGTPPASTRAEPATEDNAPPTGGELALGLVALSGTAFVLPVFVVVSSLPGGAISGLIISFGMLQAWRMTGTPVIEMSGPYRIGTLAGTKSA